MRTCRLPSSAAFFGIIVLCSLAVTVMFITQHHSARDTLNVVLTAVNVQAKVDDAVKAERANSSLGAEGASSSLGAEEGTWGRFAKADWGGASVSYVDLEARGEKENEEQFLTSDDWPKFSKKYYPRPIPWSPYKPKFATRWGFDVSAFLQRSGVKSQPPKIITWVVPPRNVPGLPEPVRLRVCPDMPCRLTTNKSFQGESAALLWNGQIMMTEPPKRSHPDQVFVFHNNEPQKPDWNMKPSFRRQSWRHNFNWTWTYRNDSDMKAFYGYIVRRHTPLEKNYQEILAKKTKLAVWMCSHCNTHGKREQFVALLKKHMSVDVYGDCGPLKCPRHQDDACFKRFNEQYKFLFAFENAFCTDYISEKFFRYYESDLIVVARGSNEYARHAPPGTFINTNDFKSTKDLAEYLKYLDGHPEEYIKILKKKDEYISLFEDWPIRNKKGDIFFMQYHFEAMGYCEICRRLWELDSYRKTIPDLLPWFDKGNCYVPGDLK